MWVNAHRSVWSGPELAAELGVTLRTLRRDVDRVRNLGYIVDAEPGQGGGYALRRGQALPALSLDEGEALAVNLALTGATGQVANAEVVSRALAKIDDILPPAARLRARELRASTDVSRVAASVDPRVLTDCADATRRRRRLRFSYVDRHGALTERWVEPHQVSCRGRVWYLGAYKHRAVIRAELAAKDAPEYMHWGSSELREARRLSHNRVRQAFASRSSKLCLMSSPHAKPPREPSVRSTRWQGTNRAMGLRAQMDAAARTADGLPRARANCE